MTAERQLHEDAVINAGPENQRQRHQVEQVPGPARDSHDGEEAESADEQNAQA